MTSIIACIDGSVYTHSVIDHAAWAATRLKNSIELLQVLKHRDADSSDLSGAISADAQQTLLSELAALDAARAKLQQKQARHVLDEAKVRLGAAGISDVTISLRHGDFLDTLAAREANAGMVVIGKRGEAADFAKLHLGSNLERVIRSSHKPVLVAARAFRPIKNVIIAFDGGPTALKVVDHAARSPLFADLLLQLVMIGGDAATAQKQLAAAAATLKAGGHQVETRHEQGVASKVIAGLVSAGGVDLLVMGAYGHSHIRALVIGSTTTEMIRSCKIPILLVR
ncbi:MAG: universal stress protein [Hyphomicrobiaceae bacterium]